MWNRRAVRSRSTDWQSFGSVWIADASGANDRNCTLQSWMGYFSVGKSHLLGLGSSLCSSCRCWQKPAIVGMSSLSWASHFCHGLSNCRVAGGLAGLSCAAQRSATHQNWTYHSLSPASDASQSCSKADSVSFDESYNWQSSSYAVGYTVYRQSLYCPRSDYSQWRLSDSSTNASNSS